MPPDTVYPPGVSPPSPAEEALVRIGDNPPEGVAAWRLVAGLMTCGAAHVIFTLEVAPEVAVVICLEDGQMAGMFVSGAISTRALQRIPLRTLERSALTLARASLAYTRERPEEWAKAPVVALDKASTSERPTRASRDLSLAALAARYVELCAESGTPTKTLAEERIMSVATIRDQLGAARQSGLLTHPGSGRAGGELTPKAEALLAGEED